MPYTRSETFRIAHIMVCALPQGGILLSRELARHRAVKMRANKVETRITHCLLCGKKLSFFQLFSNARFCADAHEETYACKRADVMLERLRMYE
jgi:hypothetical protein